MAAAISYTQLMGMKGGYLYILSNKVDTVLYVGVCEDIIKRVYEHKEKFVEGFTKRYNISKLVYYERYEAILDAIQREKQLKAGSRKKKIELIEKMNPNWKNLYDDLLK